MMLAAPESLSPLAELAEVIRVCTARLRRHAIVDRAHLEVPRLGRPGFLEPLDYGSRRARAVPLRGGVPSLRAARLFLLVRPPTLRVSRPSRRFWPGLDVLRFRACSSRGAVRDGSDAPVEGSLIRSPDPRRRTPDVDERPAARGAFLTAERLSSRRASPALALGDERGAQILPGYLPTSSSSHPPLSTARRLGSVRSSRRWSSPLGAQRAALDYVRPHLPEKVCDSSADPRSTTAFARDRRARLRGPRGQVRARTRDERPRGRPGNGTRDEATARARREPVGCARAERGARAVPRRFGRRRCRHPRGGTRGRESGRRRVRPRGGCVVVSLGRRVGRPRCAVPSTAHGRVGGALVDRLRRPVAAGSFPRGHHGAAGRNAEEPRGQSPRRANAHRVRERGMARCARCGPLRGRIAGEDSLEQDIRRAGHSRDLLDVLTVSLRRRTDPNGGARRAREGRGPSVSEQGREAAPTPYTPPAS